MHITFIVSVIVSEILVTCGFAVHDQVTHTDIIIIILIIIILGTSMRPISGEPVALTNILLVTCGFDVHDMVTRTDIILIILITILGTYMCPISGEPVALTNAQGKKPCTLTNSTRQVLQRWTVGID